MVGFLTCSYSRYAGPESVSSGDRDIPPAKSGATGRRVGIAALAATALLTGCSAAPAAEDAAIVRATLALLQSDRTPAATGLCVDARPRGTALAIFRTMRMTTEPDERPWRSPTPLGAAPRVKGRQLFEDAVGRDRLRIPEPGAPAAALPRETQLRLDAAARALSLADRSIDYVVNDDLAPPGMAVRWWLFNRLRGCERTFVLSRIARDDAIGFVTVTADHWGTTYAVERGPQGWRVTGQWDKWLY